MSNEVKSLRLSMRGDSHHFQFASPAGSLHSVNTGPDDDVVPKSNVDDDDLDALSSDLEIGELIRPMGHLERDSRDRENELDTGSWTLDAESPGDPDDSDGPTTDTTDCLVALDSMDLNDDDSAGNMETTDGILSGVLLPQLDRSDDSLEESAIDGDRTGTILDDARFIWSPQPWCETGLSNVFGPRNSLTCSGNYLLATGDSTDIVALDGLISIAEAPFLGRTRSGSFLDAEAERLLIVSVTGQLLIWNRHEQQVDSPFAEDDQTLDRVIKVCQGPTIQRDTWVLLATGEVYFTTCKAKGFMRHEFGGRCLTITAGDYALCAMLKDATGLALAITNERGAAPIRLPPCINALALAKDPILAWVKNHVLVGARDIGAWLSTDDGTTVEELTGCSNITTGTLGVFAGRPYAWVALFFELEDRSELIGIDCRSRRAFKLANFSVVSDCAGPEDDPPERARIDSLHWDSNHQRLWAAGCFGLTCFVPPQSNQPTS